jgi:hypothetical protein
MPYQPPIHNPFDTGQLHGPEDCPENFLTPEQRLEALAEILAAIHLRIIKMRIIKKRHDQDPFPQA